MASGQIRITPQELRDGATYVGGCRDEILAQVEALKSKLDEVTGNWEGAAQSAFVETFYDKIEPILRNDFPQVMEQIIMQLNGAADTMEQTDEGLAGSLRG